MLPEGLTYCNNIMYVGIASTQKIYRVSKQGNLKLFATLPTLGKNNGVMTGIICSRGPGDFASKKDKNRCSP